MSTLLEQASLVMIPSGYKEDVVYSVIPTSGAGDLSFTRASNGTRVNSAGLVEVVAWNLVEQSETFENAVWLKFDASATANATTAPNGTTTADKFVEGTGSSIHRFNQGLSIVNGQSYTFSVYAKASERTRILLRTYNGTDDLDTYFDLTNGTIVSGTGTIESVGNGWYRLSRTFTATSSISSNFINQLLLVNTGTNISYTGNGTSGLFLWGAQTNIGSTAKPYFPTTDRLNVPRLTYQNGGGGCPSLLLEKQSTNITLYSQDISNTTGTYWGDGSSGGTATLTANYATSPDGTSNATRVQINQGSLYAVWQQVIGTTSGTTYTYSIWMKAVSGTPTIVWLYDGTANRNITLTNEWVRYTWTFSAGSLMIARFAVWSSVWGTSSSADILAWGAQLEASSYPTSYIPTTSASATRVADACFKTGISSLIGQTEGVLFAEFDMMSNANSGAYQTIINIATDANNSIDILKNNTTSELYVFAINGGVIQVNSIGISGTNILGRHKIALAYKANDYVCYLDGVQVFTDTSATVPTCSNLYVGAYLGASNILAGSIAQAILFKTRLTNAELASITSL